MELTGWNLRQRAGGIGCRGGGRSRVDCGRIETVHGPVVALGLGKVMLPAESQVEGKIALHPPVVIDEKCQVLGLHSALSVEIETSAARKSEQECSQVLSQWRRGEVDRGVVGPTGIEAVGARW